MNPEELKYHTALQGVYREKMGPWQVGDRSFDNEFGEGWITSTTLEGRYLDVGYIAPLKISLQLCDIWPRKTT